MVVVDVDDISPDMMSLVDRRFGKSTVQVATPRGRHFYYKRGDQKLPNQRAEGLPIDIKSGANSYVAGPGSIRPDGGEYVAAVGLLGKTVLSIFSYSAGRTLLASQSTGRVPEGQRNQFLWRQAVEYAPFVLDVEELIANLKYDRDNLCEVGDHRVHDAEIIYSAKWAWSRRTKPGGLFKGRDSCVKSTAPRWIPFSLFQMEGPKLLPFLVFWQPLTLTSLASVSRSTSRP